MKEFILTLNETTSNGLSFITIPRDVIEPKNTLTVILKEVHRSLEVHHLPAALLRRNPILKGGVKTIRVKRFAQDEKTKNGDSKAQWRLAVLQGDKNLHGLG